MAAVLCRGIGDLTNGCCDGIGKVICLPCKACGIACTSVIQVVKTAFFPFLAFTFALNMPGVYYGLISLDFDCPSLSGWIVANGVLCFTHMVMALYIVNKIRETPASANVSEFLDSEAQAADYNNFTLPKESEKGAPNSFTRIKHVLCYDKTMAVYIIVFIAWIIWLSTGIAKRLSADGYAACDDQVQYMNITIACGHIYFWMVFLSFGCSLCCLR